MRIVGVLGSIFLIFLVLADGFESIVQPRRVTRRYRIARIYFVAVWACWGAVARRMKPGRRQAAFLSVFGPLSLLGIFIVWVVGLIVGFALLQWSLGNPVVVANVTPNGPATFPGYVYLSGTTFFTLGYGDITPATRLGRALAVSESGLGFGFLAAILSYLPVLFQAYSRREVSIALLDARAGSPPTAGRLVLRAARAGLFAASPTTLDAFLIEWERWAAELLEGQLSFPVLGYYRSQHDNQSWLAALATTLDTCALLVTQIKGLSTYQAQVTFAIARHAAVDLTLVLRAPSLPPTQDRLTPDQLQTLRDALQSAGVPLHDPAAAAERLRELRGTYEPFLQALSVRLLLTLPPIDPGDDHPDNWQRSAWMRPTPGLNALPVATADEGHFT